MQNPTNTYRKQLSDENRQLSDEKHSAQPSGISSKRDFLTSILLLPIFIEGNTNILSRKRKRPQAFGPWTSL